MNSGNERRKHESFFLVVLNESPEQMNVWELKRFKLNHEASLISNDIYLT